MCTRRGVLTSLGHKPGNEDGKSRQGDCASNDPSAPIKLFSGYATTGSFFRDGAVARCGVSTIVGVTRSPALVAQRLVPQKVRLGRVGFINASEEAGVRSIRVAIDGSNSRNDWIEFVGCLCPRADAHREVEGLLDGPAGFGGLLVYVPAGVFGKTGICLSTYRKEKLRERSNVGQWKTYDHGSQVVCAIVVWSCPLSLKGLFPVSINLVLEDAVKVFVKRVHSSSVVADQNFESGDLVEVERTVVANKRKDQLITRG